MTFKIATTSVGLAEGLVQYDVVLLVPLILKDTVRNVAGLSTVSQQQPQSHITSYMLSVDIGALDSCYYCSGEQGLRAKNTQKIIESSSHS